MDALTFLGSLSDEDKDFLKTQQITSAKTANNWIEFFRNCLDFDKVGDKFRKKYGWLSILMALPALGSGFLAFIMFGNISRITDKPESIIMLIVFILIFLATISLTIFFYSKYSKVSSYNLQCNNAVDQQILPMLMLLREESKSDQIVKLRLDLRGFESYDKITSSESGNEYGYNVTTSRHQDNWMDGETTLADGTHLIWNTQDFHTLVNKVKWKSKGRTKRKRKQKGKGLLTMQVGMNAKRYNLPPGMKDKSETGKMLTRKQDGYHWMKIQHKLNYGEGSFHIKNFVDAIAAAYTRATPVQGGKR